MTRRTLFLMGVAGASGCRRDQRPRLNVFNWSGYIGVDTVSNFEREFGVQVRYGTYESNEEMFARVATGNSGWDVVFPTCVLIQPMREYQLLAPIEHGKLSNIGNLDAMFQRPVWDPDLRWGIPYLWGATGICYSRSVAEAPTAWEDMWEPALQGRMTMLDDQVDVFAACLKKLGYSINTRNPEEIREAHAEAMEQKELLRAYINADVRDQLVAGDVLAAQLWTSTSLMAIDDSRDLAFVYPEEGFPLYLEMAAVLRESRRRDLAHRFIDYLLRPDVAAGIVRASRAATPNRGARALLEPALRDDPTLFPPADVMTRGEWALTTPPDIQKLRDRLWTELKSA